MLQAVFCIAFVIVVGLLYVTFGDDRSIIRAFGGSKPAIFFFIGLSVAIAAGITAMVAYRRRLARAADDVAVTTLAAGVRASRRITGKAGAYRDRIIAKADERDHPPPDS